ncbi:hypothetical protein HMN09_00301500 [Mycena chlorophos]|uniref:Uncharacterized protein n=1 Tax=Mycena chlorophos TaxID=658473 RepID=A0A8H6TLU1_MYCCL|nr:hypothetical protein HMN09_00301500 [Mycena chlorophos]
MHTQQNSFLHVLHVIWLHPPFFSIVLTLLGHSLVLFWIQLATSLSSRHLLSHNKAMPHTTGRWSLSMVHPKQNLCYLAETPLLGLREQEDRVPQETVGATVATTWTRLMGSGWCWCKKRAGAADKVSYEQFLEPLVDVVGSPDKRVGRNETAAFLDTATYVFRLDRDIGLHCYGRAIAFNEQPVGSSGTLPISDQRAPPLSQSWAGSVTG